MTISAQVAAHATQAIGWGLYSVVVVYQSEGAVREIEIPPARVTPALVEAVKELIINEVAKGNKADFL